MLAYTTFRDEVEALLQDSANANFTAADLDTFISQACREGGRYVPHVVQVIFTLESRDGTATSTLANNLVDASEAHFVSGDVGKVVYNRTDKTWALITTYTSSTTVVLSKDIMASGDQYNIYNAGCTRKNQVNLSNIDDYLDIDRVEYPVGTPRNWEIQGNILTFQVNTVPDSKTLSSGSTQPNTEVYVWFKKRHLISQLTDLVGSVNNGAGYAAGVTSMAINDIQATGTIETGQEFTLANVRGTYTVTADATIAANAATISFFPPLESTILDNVVITFTGSTLTPTLEPLIKELTAGLASVSESMNPYQQVQAGITAIALTTTAIAVVAARITQAIADVASGRTSNTNAATAITLANAEFGLINPQIDLAVTALAEGELLVNTVPVGAGATEFMGQGAADFSAGFGYYRSGHSYIEEAQADQANANTLLSAAARELQAGTVKIQEGQASLQKTASLLQVANSGRLFESWGRNQLQTTYAKLSRLTPNKYRTSKVYSRG